MSRLFHPDTRIFALAAATLIPLRCIACGPFFPNQVLTNGDNGVLSMPIGTFEGEVDLLAPPGKPLFTAQPPKPNAGSPYQSLHVLPAEQSAQADIAELKSALAGTGVLESKQQQMMDSYSTARKQLTDYTQALADWREKADAKIPRPILPAVAMPADLPEEFADYLQGLIAFDRGDAQAARAAWTALLSLPPNQRHLRSTWAAYMLGKSWLDSDAAKAEKWFAECRTLAADGYADSVGLASSSLGWEAKANLSTENFPAAIALYMRQKSTGDPTAAMSLRDAAGMLLQGNPDSFAATAGDDLSRRVVTAYIIADGGPYQTLSKTEKEHVSTWLNAVETAGIDNMPGADRLAWAAYSSGNFDAASRWIARAPADAPIAQWMRAKLLLRDGHVNDAAQILAKVVKSFPPDNQWLTDDGVDSEFNDGQSRVTNIIPSVVGDLAVLQLARGQYTDSMDLLLRADFWMDGAYIAERVLTVDELKTYVDRRFPEPEAVPANIGPDIVATNSRQNESLLAMRIRHLLARRLTRLGRWKEAEPYYPQNLQQTLIQYISDIRTGHDASKSDSARAASFADAARIARNQGMQLLGTELDPDFFCYDGSYQYSESPETRGINTGVKLTIPTQDEAARYVASALPHARRYHYKYIAAEHAWSAAELMPDNDEKTAALLCEAGSWIKAADPQAADRFYKALVKRCPATKLGKAAVALHWFPDPATVR